jgi:putative colanic acid biosynthesis acetyltransferase WcaF
MTDPPRLDARLLADLPETEVPPPSKRIFLPQRPRERAAGAMWAIVRSTLFRWSPRSFNLWRIWLLRLFGAKICGDAVIDPSVRIEFPWNLRIGDQVVICHNVIINCMGTVTLGDRSRISQYSHLVAGTHDYQRRDMAIIRCPIHVGNDVWVAADAFVGPGVTLEDGCLLAARSGAFRDLPAGMVCIGEPAKPVHPRDRPWTPAESLDPSM